jgi:uncharacterized protein YqgC (DUF456 family)
MKISPQTGKAASASTGGLTSPAIIVFLVIFLGAVIYLWRARYIRRTTAFFLIGVLLLILIVYGAYVYTYGA